MYSPIYPHMNMNRPEKWCSFWKNLEPASSEFRPMKSGVFGLAASFREFVLGEDHPPGLGYKWLIGPWLDRPLSLGDCFLSTSKFLRKSPILHGQPWQLFLFGKAIFKLLSSCQVAPPPPRREGKPGASLALFYGALLLIKEKGLDPHWKKMRIGKQNLATQFIDDTRNSY